MNEKPNWLIQPEQLNAKLRKSALQLVDVRGEEDFKKKNIAGSVNIPLNALSEMASTLDRNSETVVYCSCGITSLEATVRLKEMGFKNVVSLEGGFSRWSEGHGE